MGMKKSNAISRRMSTYVKKGHPEADVESDRLKGGAIVVVVVVIDGSQGHIRVPHVFELLIVFRQQSFLLIIVSRECKSCVDAARDCPACPREPAVFLHHSPHCQWLNTFSIEAVEPPNAIKPKRHSITFYQLVSFPRFKWLGLSKRCFQNDDN